MIKNHRYHFKFLLVILFFLILSACGGGGITPPVDDEIPPVSTSKIYNQSTGVGYDTIQKAIDAAIDGQTIIVNPGTYHENIQLKGRRITVQSSRPNNPSVVATTIIDGGKKGSVVTITGGDSSTLKGFTIRNGDAQHGGGIYILSSNPTITGNTIIKNEAIHMSYDPSGPGWTPTGGGGGIYIESSSHPVITNNIITENESGFLGGGIACMKSTPTITGNTITKNKVSLFGGGGIIVWECTGTFLIQDNIISENKGAGAGVRVYDSSPTIKGNTITDNKGNGIYLSDSSSTVSGNTITGNKENHSGAGISISGGSPTITGNTISNNSSESEGGGISISRGSPTITGNTISNNSAASGGGGIYISHSSPTIRDNTISGNRTDGEGATLLDISGGGVFVDYGSTLTFTGNTVSNNIAKGWGGGLYITSSGNLLPANARPAGWGTGRESIPEGYPLAPAEGVTVTIAGNKFQGNRHGTPSGYTKGAHVMF